MSKLFTPYNLSGLALKNRVVMAPMTRTRTMNDVPDEVVALYYAQRASAGLLITEGMPVSEEGRVTSIPLVSTTTNTSRAGVR